MKHVGVNVAADPIFTAAYNGVGAGFVIVSADDPDMHSSQNEQDNRRYAPFAKIPLVEPSDSQECKDFMKEAYEISERFDLPVLFRVTTRICHSKSLVEFGEREERPVAPYARNIPKFVCTPANAKRHRPMLEAKLEHLAEYAETSPLNRMELKGNKIGVVTSSIAYQYAKEAFPEDTSFLKLGFTWPLPIRLIRSFAEQVETLYVVEELDPFLEDQIKAAASSASARH
jgi:indolepyruvate ferredoxin oxidoreductase alpha subunit